MKATMTLVDDGTLDVVLRCSGCGGVERYSLNDGEENYEDFVEWAAADAGEIHDHAL